MTLPTEEFTVLTEQQLQSLRTRIVDAGGDIAKAGLGLQDVRNAIYTKMYRVNPDVEAQHKAAAATRAEKKAATPGKRTTLKGPDMDSLIG